MAWGVDLRGIMPALVTPFGPDGEVDVEGFKRNVASLLEAGVSGVVCNGSTGEAVALTRAERKTLIEAAVQVCGGRVPVIAGTGAATTREAVELAQDAREAGASAALVITPYNLIPGARGLYEHYAAVSDVGLPVILYNLPQHTGVGLSLEVLDRLVRVDRVVGIKDSGGDLAFMAEVIHRFGHRIAVLSGCDDMLLQSFCTGAVGAIVALANIAPRMLVQMLRLVQAGRLAEARDIYFRLLPIARVISRPVNFPAPVKEAVRLLGLSAGPPRPPIVPVEEDEADLVRRGLVCAGLIAG